MDLAHVSSVNKVSRRMRPTVPSLTLSNRSLAQVPFVPVVASATETPVSLATRHVRPVMVEHQMTARFVRLASIP